MSEFGPSGLTRDGLHGIWAGITTPWTEDDRLDADAFATAVETVAKWGVHGIYTTGGTGEFWGVGDNEFPVLMDALEAGRRAGGPAIPTKAGITALDTRSTLRRAEMAMRGGVNALQVSTPVAYPLRDEDVIEFHRSIARAYPGVPIVNWNYRHTSRPLLTGQLYRRLADAVPEFIGVKVDLPSYELWHTYTAHAPEIGYLVGEPVLPQLMRHGARGSCSSTIYLAPKVTLDMYAAARNADWATADRLAADLDSFFRDAVIPLMAQGYADPAIDKCMAAAAGWIPVSHRVRAPYASVTSADVSAMRALIESKYPHFLEAPAVAAPLEPAGAAF